MDLRRDGECDRMAAHLSRTKRMQRVHENDEDHVIRRL
jgi:hypothetical protein